MTRRPRLLSVAALVALQAPAFIAAAQMMRYDGQQVVRIPDASARLITQLDAAGLDIWTHRPTPGLPLDVRVTPQQKAALDAEGIAYEIMIEDVQAAVDAERGDGQNIAGDWFSDYRSTAEVSAYIDQLVALRPDIASRIELGDSLQGRDISGIRISGPGNDKPAFLINGCQHAREWVAVMTPMYIADQLIRQYQVDPEITSLVNRVEFFIVPIVNPDGYEYSRTSDRFWRKNRRGGYGVDLNRNWSVGWGGSGSSGNQNSEIYRGTAPFSEPETQRLRDFIDANPNIDAHIDFHSYSQLILQPWSYTETLPPDHAEFNALGSDMADAIHDVHNEVYEHGPGGRILYIASGTAPDWSYGERDAIGFTIELRDTGQYGFVLPRSQIVPTGEENLAGVLVMAEHIAPDIFMTVEADALFWGQVSDVRTFNAPPGEEVFFYWTRFGEGSTFIPGLGVTLGLDSPVLGGSEIADASGLATFSVRPPNRRGALVIWIQSAVAGDTSNVLVTQIN